MSTIHRKSGDAYTVLSDNIILKKKLNQFSRKAAPENVRLGTDPVYSGLYVNQLP
jgi:hypothetical protein